jgi:hypothetical protein
MIIFWNFAGVPFVMRLFFPSETRIHLNFADIRVFRCLHGIARPLKVPLLDTNLRVVVHYAAHGVLRVRSLRNNFH